jgi:HEAT repeats
MGKEMIDQQLINMLDDPNPQVRASAVKQLAKTQSQEAVRYLATIYKTDDNPEVRELARKAGLYIKKKMNEGNWTGGDADPNATEQAPSDEVNVSPRAVESAIGQMESAMNLHVAGEDEKAAKFVEKAFMANPNLKNDSYYLGMAATILGLPGDEVANFLLADVEFDAKGKAKRKRKPKAKNVESEVSTETAIIDLVIYFIVIATLVAVGMLILISLFDSAIQIAMTESPEFAAVMRGEGLTDPSQQIFIDLVNGFVQGGFVISVVSGIAMGIYSVIVLVVQLGCMHIVATMLLGGEGTFKQLIHKMTGVITAFTVAYVLIFMLMIYVMFNGVVNENLNAFNTVNVLNSLMSLGSLGYLIWFVMALGKVYNYSTGAGCGTIIIGLILFGIVMMIISVGLSVAFSPIMFNLMGGMPASF